MPRRVCSALGFLSVFVVSVCSAYEPSSPSAAEHPRRPVRLVVTDHHLLVANAASGTISVIDPELDRVVAEPKVADRIRDVVLLRESATDSIASLLVLDDQAGRLSRVDLRASGGAVRPICEVPRDATRIAWDARRRCVLVSCRWRREVLMVSLAEGLHGTASTRTITLPFSPHDLQLLDDHHLLVADAFGGRLCLVALDADLRRTFYHLYGHNIRGLSCSPDDKMLHIAHQQVVPRAKADYEELHWGRMVTNAVQSIPVSQLLSSEEGSLVKGWIDSQDGIGAATGDPSAVVAGGEGLVAVAFAGVHEVAVRRPGYVKRIPVGRGPRAMALGHERLYVANYFDDSLSVIDPEQGRVSGTIRLGPQPEWTAVERGEQLFYDARLSHDGWISCHSCHTDGHSAGLLVDTLGDGDYGAPKRVPSLLGTGATGPWSWTGEVGSLAAQVAKSVETTMHGEALSPGQVSDLVAYLEQLAPPPRAEFREEPARGRELFASLGCIDCHAPPTYTTPEVYDVGLRDERKRQHFNPPSLRGVAHRNRLFHDGRAESLEAVLIDVEHQLDQPLSGEDAQALLDFLRSL